MLFESRRGGTSSKRPLENVPGEGIPTSVGTRNAGVPFLGGTPSLGTQRRGAKKVSKNSYFVHYPRVCARHALQFFSPAEAQGRKESLIKIHSLPVTDCRVFYIDIYGWSDL
jgi:hypothetical protein